MARAWTGKFPHDDVFLDNPGSSGIADARCYVRTSGGGYAYPTAGADVDGAMFHVSEGGITRECSFGALPGAMITLESAAAFSSGAELATAADGRVQTKGTGQIAIARSLEAAAAAGQIVKCVWTSGRRA